MKHILPPRISIASRCGLAAAVLFGVGCTDPQVIIDDALAASNPAAADGPVGPPPVEVGMLGIEATPVLPTHVMRVDPQPILPKMDDAFEGRRLPKGYGPGGVIRKAGERELPGATPVQEGEEDPADPGDGPAMEGK